MDTALGVEVAVEGGLSTRQGERSSSGKLDECTSPDPGSAGCGPICLGTSPWEAPFETMLLLRSGVDISSWVKLEDV